MMNIADELTRQAQTSPDAIAVLVPNGDLNYRQLETLTWRAATYMHQQGINKSEVIALSFSDELTLLIAFLAAVRLGCTAVTLSLGMSAIQREEILRTAEASSLLRDRPVNWEEQRRIVTLTFEYLLKEANNINFSLREPKPEAYCVIDVGSGSTGRRKLIPYTHRQFLEIATRTARQYSLSADDRLATLVHLNFVSTKRRYLSMISSGGSIVLFHRSGVDPVALVNQHEISILIGTVVHLERLLSSLPESAHNVMPGLRILVVTSSIVSTALRNRIAEKLTENLYINYGANECTTMTWAQPPEVFEIEGTVGTPLDGVSVEVIDPDSNPLPHGEIGQIRLQAPGMVDGYLNDIEASRKSFRDGWFYPGDLGKFTEMGQLIYCGRADHMMIMNGINIYPAEIEKIVTAHPAIRDAAAVPLRHTVHQDVPVCAISFHVGMSVTQQEMFEYVNQRLGAHSPKFIVIFEEIPRDERGKLRRAELYQQLRRKLQGQVLQQ